MWASFRWRFADGYKGEWDEEERFKLQANT